MWASLEKFLAKPSFYEGVALGGGPGTGITRDPVTGAVTDPTIINYNRLNIDTTTNDGVAPGQVAALVLTGGVRSLFATWAARTETDMANGRGTYQIQVATDAGFTAIVADKLDNATMATVTGLTSGTTYYVRVRATDLYGTSGTYSATANVVIPTVNTADITVNAITADRIVANAVTAAKLSSITFEVGKYIQSNLYNGTDVETGNATQGWRIQANGNCEFWNGVFRGTVSGATIIGGTIKTANATEYLELSNSWASEIRYVGPNSIASGGIIFDDTGFLPQLTLNTSQSVSGADIASIALFGATDTIDTADIYMTADSARVYLDDNAQTPTKSYQIFATPAAMINRGFSGSESVPNTTLTNLSPTAQILTDDKWILWESATGCLMPEKAGWYEFGTIIEFAPSATGYRKVVIGKNNGTNDITVLQVPGAPTVATIVSCFTYIQIVTLTGTTRDKFKVKVAQTSGAAMNVLMKTFYCKLLSTT